MASIMKLPSQDAVKDLRVKLFSNKTLYVTFGPDLKLIKWLGRFNFGTVKTASANKSDKFRSDLMIYSWAGYKVVPLNPVARLFTAKLRDEEDLDFIIYKPNWLDKLALMCYNWTL
jgi:hypothetical protein